jgi:hypothetical protein
MSKMVSIQVMDACGHAEVQIHPFLTSALDRFKLSALLHGRFFPREMSLKYPLRRWLDGNHSRSGRCGKQKNLSLCRVLNVSLDYPAQCLVTTPANLLLLSYEGKEYWNQKHRFPSHIPCTDCKPVGSFYWLCDPFHAFVPRQITAT